jgi:hypothetical protein
MAKNSTAKIGPSRVRFIMVDAEIADGDITAVTQAITNALKGPTPVAPVRRLTAVAPAVNGAAEPQEIEGEIEDVEDDVATVDITPAKQRAPRKPSPTPDVVVIDMDSDISLATFANGKDAGSQHKKYLIAAAWLKEHRSTDAVGAGHIYTCFRSMDWPTNIPDFWQPLRDLKAKKYFVKNDKGDYEINHIGLAYVKKLGGSNGAG